MITRTRTPAFWGYPLAPHDYPYYWPAHIVKTRQSQSYKFKVFAKTSNFLILKIRYKQHTFCHGLNELSSNYCIHTHLRCEAFTVLCNSHLIFHHQICSTALEEDSQLFSRGYFCCVTKESKLKYTSQGKIRIRCWIIYLPHLCTDNKRIWRFESCHIGDVSKLQF